jgi:nucleoside-diphosphate-sugar epimerase
MKVLVTGGTGFLGRRTAQCLLKRGYEVVATGRNLKLGKELEKEGICFLAIDLSDEKGMIEAGKVDYVIHCGALSSPWGTYNDFYSANVIGTRNVVRVCQENGVKKLVHVSTPSLYFEFKDQFNIPENYPLPQPCNLYAKTKQMAEAEVDQFAQAITIRPRGIFGPGDTTIIPRIIQSKKIPLFYGGKALVDLTYVDNVVDALILAMESPLEGKKYNITNGESWEIRQLIELLFKKLDKKPCFKAIPYPLAYMVAWAMELCSGKEPPFTRYTLGVLAKSQTLNIQAARDELGYQPKISISDGLDRFAEWWRTRHD